MKQEIIKIVDPITRFDTYHYVVTMDNGQVTSYILSGNNLSDSLISLGFSEEDAENLIGALNA
jgi:hypothetical protein